MNILKSVLVFFMFEGQFDTVVKQYLNGELVDFGNGIIIADRHPIMQEETTCMKSNTVTYTIVWEMTDEEVSQQLGNNRVCLN